MGEFLVWDASLLIGVANIDAEHKELVSIANDILMIKNPSAEMERVRSSLLQLRSYTETHFANEEAYMAEIKYAGLEDHKQKHHQIISDMNALLKESGGVEELVERLAIFMKQWVLRHISEEDLQLKPKV